VVWSGRWEPNCIRYALHRFLIACYIPAASMRRMKLGCCLPSFQRGLAFTEDCICEVTLATRSVLETLLAANRLVSFVFQSKFFPVAIPEFKECIFAAQQPRQVRATPSSLDHQRQGFTRWTSKSAPTPRTPNAHCQTRRGKGDILVTRFDK
jgi:hypothetical protein